MDSNSQHSDTNHVHPILYWAGAAGAIVIVALLVYGTFFSRQYESVALMVGSIRSGDYQGALESYNRITGNPQTSADERALAILNTVSIRYQISGSIDDLLLDVRDMKREIQNSEVSPTIRANMLTELAMRYSASGKDPAVFSEIFEQNDSFSEYLVSGDPDASIFNIVEWSYNVIPTSYAAMYLATAYSWSAFIEPNQTDTAEQYYKDAERLLEQELASGYNSTKSARYAIYLFWHAIVSDRLAQQKGEPYTTENARKEFSDLFTFIEEEDSVPLKEKLLTYARLYYAIYIAADASEATVVLDKLAGDLVALRSPDTNSTILFMRNEYRNNSIWWRDIERGMSVSPDFNSVVRQLVIDRQTL